MAPQCDNGCSFDRWMTGEAGEGDVLPPARLAWTKCLHTHTLIHAQNAYTDPSPASRRPLIEMEERCGRSKCLQMTRWEWIGSCALVMLLHPHQIERKTDGVCGGLSGTDRQVRADRQTAGKLKCKKNFKHSLIHKSPLQKQKPKPVFMSYFFKK